MVRVTADVTKYFCAAILICTAGRKDMIEMIDLREIRPMILQTFHKLIKRIFSTNCNITTPNVYIYVAFVLTFDCLSTF